MANESPVGPYKNLTCYFMSGTGNTFRAASWFAERAGESGAAARLRKIEEAEPKNEIDGAADHLVGIGFPTHGFTAPWHMIRFLARMPQGKGAPVFVFATRGGSKIGAAYLPGLSGTGLFLAALILAIKGYRVRGFFGVDMPSNWTALHPGYKSETVEAIKKRSKTKGLSLFGKIFAGRSHYFSANLAFEFVFGLALLPISTLYLIMGRFVLAKLFFADKDCTGCGVCAVNCPVGAIRMIGRKNPRPFWRYNCESCMRCMAYCPEKAVEAGHSFLIVLYFLTSIPFSVYFFLWASRKIPWIANLDTHFSREALDFLLTYPALFLSYYLLHLATRFRWTNRLLTYSTFTRLYRRYHEPQTRVGQLTRAKKPQE